MNKSKVVLYIAMSLDGYIARKDGSVDWLFDIEGDQGDNGYGEFYKTIGTVVMGRKTYEEVLVLSDDFPYKDKPCYVLSRTKHHSAPHVRFTDEELDPLLCRLKDNSNKDIWIVGGGQIVQACLERYLLEELYIAIIPKVLGDGIPLFPNGTIPSAFRLIKTETIGQIVSLHYSSLE